MLHSPKRARLTIGVILDQVAGESRSSLWPGIADTIAAHDGNILCFAGGYLRPSDDPAARSNIVYELVDTGALDGLIIWTSALASYVAHDSLLRFCDRFRPLPTVSIGLALAGIPGVVLDSYQGMREALIHLITVHARRRLVFIRGPEGHRDADERYRAYRDVLKEYGLPYVPELVSPPYKWYDPGGLAMMQTLLDDQHLEFDAVVSSHDAAAVQAMEALQARGIRVPEDVSITGFDDTPLSRLVTPPLTTVPWRMYERGCQAATLLMSMLAGETVPNEVRLPAHLVVRQSCGCLDPSVMQARTAAPVVDVTTAAPPHIFGADLRDLCMAALEQVIDDRGKSSEWLDTFLDTFFADLTGETSGEFLPALDKILRQVASAGGDIASWQAAVSALRRRLLPALLGDDKALVRAEDLWHQARVMIGEHARRLRGYREWLAHQQTEHLRRISRGLATKTTIPDLMNVLAKELPHLGIRSCYLALYEDPSQPTEWCRLMLAYDENGRLPLPPEGRRVRAKHLAAGGEMPTDKPYHILVAPLYFQDDQLGLILFAQQPVGDIYEVLRDEISTTLKGILLAEQNVSLYQQALAAEKAAQEGRLLAEEADRLKSSFLSMVSHELLTPLVLLVGLSEMMLREGTGNRPPLPAPYRADLARIHLSAQHLGNLVRDVLDLTRSQMGLLKLTKKPIDLHEMIKAVALVGEEMARGKGLDWQADVSPCLPTVYGDSSRLQQVALNLVANAVKFTSRGYVRLAAREESGNVTIEISDTGPGVPIDEQEVIFDEFRQSERTAARGYGGLGIGLAICRQLVELHGGQIGVRSAGDEEGGSTFYFTLPAMTSPASAAPAGASDSTVLLLAENISSSSAPLLDFLSREGFKVRALYMDETSDWQAKLECLSPGAVVLDCEPASERGWRVVETLKDNPATAEIPVLFYSLQPQDAGSMLAVDYVSKPLGGSSLAQALTKHGLASDKCDDSTVILVVDDDPDILDMHARMVRVSLPECRVLQASNGRAAMEIMARQVPALVLLDLMMPELDGMGVLAAMQESERLRGVPVIILTAQVLTQKEMAQLNQRVAAILGKGLFTAQETMAHIEKALARNKRLGSETQRMVRKAMSYIHEHYAEAVTREDMASVVGVSARHLTRFFHQEVGISPITYLNRYRVRQAKQLLEAGDKNVSEVAAAVGFSTSSHFTDAFRREVGVSPRDYQKGRRKP